MEPLLEERGGNDIDHERDEHCDNSRAAVGWTHAGCGDGGGEGVGQISICAVFGRPTIGTRDEGERAGESESRRTF